MKKSKAKSTAVKAPKPKMRAIRWRTRKQWEEPVGLSIITEKVRRQALESLIRENKYNDLTAAVNEGIELVLAKHGRSIQPAEKGEAPTV